jgi:hypothetical protein
VKETSQAIRTKLEEAAALGLMMIGVDESDEDNRWDWYSAEVADIISEALTHLREGVPYPYDYFNCPDRSPFDLRRFQVDP